MKHILVATDGSETADRAILRARVLAECTGSKVTMINIAGSNLLEHRDLLSEEDEIQTNKDLIRLGQELLEKKLRLFDGFQGTVETITRGGDASNEIINEAERGDYDLVIMGSRGLGTFSRALLGSVSNKVLNHVGKDVMIIR